MTQPGPSGPDTGPEPPEEPGGSMRPTPPGLLVAVGLLTLVLGWSIRPLSLATDRVAPSVPGLSVGIIWFGAAIVALTAYLTWRTLHRERGRLPVHQAVNRLLVAKASAVVGAVLAGGYVGNAIAHLGVGEAHARAQVWWSLGAAAGGVALLLAALFLERACRVPRDTP